MGKAQCHDGGSLAARPETARSRALVRRNNSGPNRSIPPLREDRFWGRRRYCSDAIIAPEESPMTTFKVGYFVGSLATASINRKLAMALVRLAHPGFIMSEIPFRDLPLYSYDYDADYPPVARAFKQAIADVDAVLFVTPEYNRSIPGGLKNAIDWASRPWGQNAFTRKPSAVIGASIGAIGTAVSQQNLRSVLSFCNSPQMNAPEAYIHFTPDLVDDEGNVSKRDTEEFLRTYMAEFHQFVTRVYMVLPRGE